MPAGQILRVETLVRATVHWGLEGWREVRDVETVDTGLGLHFADLDSQALPAGSRVQFTFYWPDENRWEGTNFQVDVEALRATLESSD
jgi:glucoamylase